MKNGNIKIAKEDQGKVNPVMRLQPINLEQLGEVAACLGSIFIPKPPKGPPVGPVG